MSAYLKYTRRSLTEWLRKTQIQAENIFILRFVSSPLDMITVFVASLGALIKFVIKC